MDTIHPYIIVRKHVNEITGITSQNVYIQWDLWSRLNMLGGYFLSDRLHIIICKYINRFCPSKIGMSGEQMMSYLDKRDSNSALAVVYAQP